MNDEAFLAGYNAALTKSGGVMDWLRSNVYQPAAQGVIDGHYRGLGTYNPENNSVEPNTMNGIRAVTGAPQQSSTPEGFFQKGLYRLGKTTPAKWITNKFIMSDDQVNSRISGGTSGVLSMNDGKVNVDRSKIPGLLVDKARDWIGRNGNTLKGIGLGAGALGLGYMAYKGMQKTPQVAAPAGQSAAPFTGVKTPRRGNYFEKYQ